ncbi:hypothetical protein NDU88_003015 [Pleurodeles waltl]|uniref:Uncharacterized protein n=1 Tax=Pleurodeles waltl TaxID=8319 RepID=A0AAV7V0I1_PLEWA|nr:hypothetical protein NDU88_003015 [Pleurodeles waltl]
MEPRSVKKGKEFSFENGVIETTGGGEFTTGDNAKGCSVVLAIAVEFSLFLVHHALVRIFGVLDFNTGKTVLMAKDARQLLGDKEKSVQFLIGKSFAIFEHEQKQLYMSERKSKRVLVIDLGSGNGRPGSHV